MKQLTSTSVLGSSDEEILAEFVSLSMRDMDMSVLGLIRSNQLGLFGITGSSGP